MDLVIDHIVVGDRARQDLGDIADLADSIHQVGLLHPPVVRRDGDRFILVAGARRLAAMRSMGYSKTEVKVSYSITDELTALAAERDENTCRKPFTMSEAVALANQIEERIAADARERQSEAGKTKASSKLDEAPTQRRTDTRVAKAVGVGRTTLAKAREVVATATDESLPAEVRETAAQAVVEMDRTGKVDRSHQKVKLIKAWAEAVERFPFLDGVPVDEQPRMLAGAQQLSQMEGRELERRTENFRRHAEGLKRRDPGTEATKRSLARARKDTGALTIAITDVERLVTSVLDHPEVIQEYPMIGRSWAEMADACRSALDRLDEVTKPQLRRVK